MSLGTPSGDLKCTCFISAAQPDGCSASIMLPRRRRVRPRLALCCVSRTAEGIKAYDFLGEMTEHKRAWLAKERTGCDLFIGHRTIKNRLLFSGEIWPTGRFLRQAPLSNNGGKAPAAPVFQAEP